MYVTAWGYTWTSNSYGQGSDERLKRDIITTPHALNDVLSLRGVNYYWKDPAKGDALQLGLIAQEVEKVIPEVVAEDKEGMKAVSYSNLVAVLIEAIKEEHAEKESQVTALKASLKKAQDDAVSANARAVSNEATIKELKNLVCRQYPEANVCATP
ncbi:MAG: tail fiber domain-containing protein [Deltaproteobacteria bacterium]|nr:tail fiber domain-containing protein [Deltaproteobacteria bacterium]